MAIDVIKSKVANPIKNGTLIVSCSRTGNYSLSNLYVSNLPTITDIENKYDDRFDDPSYYYGNGGGNVLGVNGDVLGV